MRLITWNIQWGKGCDGVVDLDRVVATAQALGDADVYCFQEVSDGFTRLDGGVDQSAVLAALLPHHRPVFRPAVEAIDADGRVRRFGNMTLSRLPVLQVENHLLPWPQAGHGRSMRREALAVTVAAAFGPLRVVNTHLEFHFAAQREAQILRLLDLQEEASTSPRAASSRHDDPYAGQTLAASSLLCGDFNFDVSDPQHALLQDARRRGHNYRDAWLICHPQGPRPPTCGIHDRELWDGPDCRDFIFVTEDLAARVRRVAVDGETAASDHQPLLIELAD
ncbi:endonuclease/exonuclease/phosphatase family protein [Bradyrhizobium sp. U87765 SZCCT0131]|uniref:endonuclease/exonuclease/phosphatase family protein n=1 Tax=unclassified Bradyrhizobium TaxID=2631580 RepID=UPI001BADAB55|nr:MULTISPECIES: endonuclease/exonuclease/phosphatase family protein [unclassified Bradyrhizobium]MBR1218347.1 endonuclease/exonuclease/phosphatase family protein [Bradyrhizobium sp. U87765 SZCCT0131]MBR1260707.1 endonuclease/exonuclease/phosphatase family protein [Bradyrhizobium sp. U87765 SZCCT0134]MBR1303845.1 endonuclease/exonuclease/phosphatase family protein [Bradyrhizobium sp. U87765 SZCCT0110]MBR1319451.1 endonuclease/exonuclease/phosphatase family protein [Bradyrhizobium sp. U87765 SZC